MIIDKPNKVSSLTSLNDFGISIPILGSNTTGNLLALNFDNKRSSSSEFIIINPFSRKTV